MRKTAQYANEIRPGLWFVRAADSRDEFWIEGGANTGAFTIVDGAAAAWA